MLKPLTVIMPFLNEETQPVQTLDSLYDTCDCKLFDVIAVNDASDGPAPDLSKYAYVINHLVRRGVDACRHEAINFATTPYILVIDAHMRFTSDNWLARLLHHLESPFNASTVFCTQCVGLGYGVDRIEDATNHYFGATLNVVSSEPSITKAGETRLIREVLEGKWIRETTLTTPFEVACIMGANYAFNKHWYCHLHGLEGLRKWGSSEPFLSLKSWLAGGKCACLPDIQIGHYFRDSSPFATNVWELVFNKLLLMSILLPAEISAKCVQNLPQDGSLEKAYEFISQPAVSGWVQAERNYFDTLRKVDFYDFAAKFNIPL